MGKYTYKIDISLVMDKPVNEIMVIADRCSKLGDEKAGVEQQVAIAAMYVAKELRHYRFTTAGSQLTLKNFYALRKNVGDEFIHIHRINYMTWWAIQEVHEWMVEKKMLTTNANKYWRLVEKSFYTYQDLHFKLMELSSWRTVQDHVRLAANLINPLKEPLEISIRDYLIQKRGPMVAAGQKDDITLLSKVGVCLLFCAALRNTRQNFFARVEERYGIDFTPDFKYADISAMGRNFMWMTEQLGVKLVKDKDGDFVLLGVSLEKSVRVEANWNSIVDIVTDDVLMDEVALKAINLNPKVKADYEAVVAKEQQAELDDALGDLSTKFKVGKL